MTPTTAPPTTGKAVVLYDGACPLCRRSVRILQKLDWLNKLHPQDARDVANLPPCEVLLVPKKLLEEMHVVTPDRRHAPAGFRAFRWLAWRLPLAWPLAPLLYLPGAAWLGGKVYRWVARNRFNLVPCKDGVCHLPAKGGGG